MLRIGSHSTVVRGERLGQPADRSLQSAQGHEGRGVARCDDRRLLQGVQGLIAPTESGQALALLPPRRRVLGIDRDRFLGRAHGILVPAEDVERGRPHRAYRGGGRQHEQRFVERVHRRLRAADGEKGQGLLGALPSRGLGRRGKGGEEAGLAPKQVFELRAERHHRGKTGRGRLLEATLED